MLVRLAGVVLVVVVITNVGEASSLVERVVPDNHGLGRRLGRRRGTENEIEDYAPANDDEDRSEYAANDQEQCQRRKSALRRFAAVWPVVVLVILLVAIAAARPGLAP